MSQEIAEVHVDDFMKITMDPLPHKLIENALSEMGGGGVNGMTFKQEMLKIAGWKGDKLTSYAKRPEIAAEAFNRVRLALAKNDHPDDLRLALSAA